MNKQCRKCGYFIQYYSKSLHNFYLEKIGFCIKREDYVTETFCCNCFKCKDKLVVTVQIIDKVIEDIHIIESFLFKNKK